MEYRAEGGRILFDDPSRLIAMTSAVAPFAERTITHILESRAAATPDRRLLVIGERTFTAAELNETVNRVAHGLLQIGFGSGVTTALLSSNRPEMVVAWLALAKIGAVCVPINIASKAPQLAHVLSNSQSRALVAESRWLPELRQVQHDLPALERIVTFDPVDAGASEHGRQMSAFENLLTDRTENPPVSVDPVDLASIMYTGGTTGPSKGVMCSQSQYYWWARTLSEAIGLAESDVWYTCLPMFHINAQGTFLASLLTGATISVGERFSARGYWNEARRAGATVCSLLGTMSHILYHREPAPDERPPQLRLIFCPAFPAALQLAFEARFGVRVMNAYGSTELNCVTMTGREGPSRPGSMGPVLEYFEMKVVDENDCALPFGTPGELIVRPKQPFSTMLGYFGLPEKTMEAWRNLWFHTGDRAYQNADGDFYFVDRLRDSIRRRGENISSFEVEQVVNGHEAVLESAAYPVPAEVGEDDVMVSIVPRPNCRVDAVELIQWCEARLPRFAVPRFVDIVTELPKTAVGRVEKFKLRARGVTETTWDRER
jgi:carnitine-CoA ligase